MWAVSERGVVIQYKTLNAVIDEVRGEVIDRGFTSETRPALIAQMSLSDNIVQAGLVPAGSLRAYIDDMFDCKIGDRIVYDGKEYEAQTVTHIDRASVYELVLKEVNSGV